MKITFKIYRIETLKDIMKVIEIKIKYILSFEKKNNF
jgi:hypothetical protein